MEGFYRSSKARKLHQVLSPLQCCRNLLVLNPMGLPRFMCLMSDGLLLVMSLFGLGLLDFLSLYYSFGDTVLDWLDIYYKHKYDSPSFFGNWPGFPLGRPANSGFFFYEHLVATIAIDGYARI